MYQELTKDTKSFAYARLFLSAAGTPLSNLLYSRNISGITLSGTGPVAITTSVNHGFVTGDRVVFHNVGGTTELNLNAYTITKTGDATFTLDGTDSSTFSAWTTGGTCQNYTLRWFTGAGDFTDYLAPASASAQNRAGSSSCVITLEASLLDTEGIYCLELGHGLCHPAVVLVRVADAPAAALTADAIADEVETRFAQLISDIDTALTLAHGANSWQSVDLEGATINFDVEAIAAAVNALLVVEHGDGSWEGGGTFPTPEEFAVIIEAYLASLHGAGVWGPFDETNLTFRYTVSTQPNGAGQLIPFAKVVCTDLDETTQLQIRHSDENGVAHFHLPAGTYKFWPSKDGWEPEAPDIETVGE